MFKKTIVVASILAAVSCSAQADQLGNLIGTVEGINNDLFVVQDQVGKLEDQVTSQNDTIGKLDQQLGNLAGTVEGINNDLFVVQDQVGKLEDQVTSQNDTIGKLDQQLGNLAGTVDGINNDLFGVQDQVGKLEDQVGKHEDKINSNTNDIHGLQQQAVENALHDKNQDQNISVNQSNIEKNKQAIAAHYAEMKNNFAAVNSRIDNLDEEMKKGFASQAALNGLFQPYNVGKFNLSVALGGYESEQALALGTGYRFNENIAMKAGLATDVGGFDHITYNIGANFEW